MSVITGASSNANTFRTTLGIPSDPGAFLTLVFFRAT